MQMTRITRIFYDFTIINPKNPRHLRLKILH